MEFAANFSTDFPSERRSGIDRRQKAVFPWSLESFRGSRRYERRWEDRRKGYYVDRYSRRIGMVVLITVILSIVDALLTLHLVSLGAQEINPVMDFMLTKGPYAFLAVKYILTAVGLLLLLIHKNYRVYRERIPVRLLLVILPLFYVLLIGYECLLLWEVT